MLLLVFEARSFFLFVFCFFFVCMCVLSVLFVVVCCCSLFDGCWPLLWIDNVVRRC